MCCVGLLWTMIMSNLSGPGLLISPKGTPLFSPWTVCLQFDSCGEFHNEPNHLGLFVVMFDLHSKWPKVSPMATVNLCCCD